MGRTKTLISWKTDPSTTFPRRHFHFYFLVNPPNGNHTNYFFYKFSCLKLQETADENTGLRAETVILHTFSVPSPCAYGPTLTTDNNNARQDIPRNGIIMAFQTTGNNFREMYVHLLYRNIFFAK